MARNDKVGCAKKNLIVIKQGQTRLFRPTGRVVDLHLLMRNLPCMAVAKFMTVSQLLCNPPLPVTAKMAVKALPNGVGWQHHSLSHCERQERQRVVLKFGGTSVGKFAPEIARICSYYYLFQPTSLADIGLFLDQASRKTRLLLSALLEVVNPKPRELPIGACPPYTYSESYWIMSAKILYIVF